VTVQGEIIEQQFGEREVSGWNADSCFLQLSFEVEMQRWELCGWLRVMFSLVYKHYQNLLGRRAAWEWRMLE
jgi:hypothetical protein